MNGHTLDVGGHYQYRKEGEYHLFNPETIHKLQHACRSNNYEVFKEYSDLVNNQAKRLCTLRGLFELKLDRLQRPDCPVLEEVEPVEAIMKRFKSGAMSYGSISQEAHETLAIAMNRIGGKSNTGEGGEDPARYSWTNERGDSKNSAIKQVASGRFGVTSEYLVNAQELQIKMAQGAKPGEGGQLPGSKVYPWIAKVRHSTPGVGLISPPPHHDIYSIEDLAELIHDLKNANSQARISVKLVAEVGVGTIAAGVSKAHADVVLISGHDGGTGASPLTSIKHAGAPWELGLAETQQTLVLNDLRSRIVVEVDGQLKTGRDVVIGALLGAEEFGFATAPLVALGCIMMRVCHLNTCPVGVATQDPELRKKFTGDPEHAVNFMRFIAEEVRELMAQLGFRTFEEMVGHADRLETATGDRPLQGARASISAPIFYQPKVARRGRPATARKPQDHGLDEALDRNDAATAVPAGPGARRPGVGHHAHPQRQPRGRHHPRQRGHAPLRRAAACPTTRSACISTARPARASALSCRRGMTLVLEGDANDYVGKGLSGGKIIVVPAGRLHLRPCGERHHRQRGLLRRHERRGLHSRHGRRALLRPQQRRHAVVEAVGDHGCEYMTGGRVVVLGPTGRNFAAGMSGGIAYVLDEAGDFRRAIATRRWSRCSSSRTQRTSRKCAPLIRRHAELHRQRALAAGPGGLGRAMVPRFVKVYPNDYRRCDRNAEALQVAGPAGRRGRHGGVRGKRPRRRPRRRRCQA